MKKNFRARARVHERRTRCARQDLREKCRDCNVTKMRAQERERYGIGTHGNSSQSRARQRKREHFTISRMRRESRRICVIFSASPGLEKLTLFTRQTCRVARKRRLSLYSYRAFNYAVSPQFCNDYENTSRETIRRRVQTIPSFGPERQETTAGIITLAYVPNLPCRDCIKFTGSFMPVLV